jgi:hypothetical protein
MTLEEIRGKIKDCAARMNAAYGATVFDEWSVVSLELEHARILYYTGPRNDEFLKNFVADLGTLRAALLDDKFGAGDFEFSRQGVGTRHEAFLVLGKDLFLICNNTRESMETIAKNPRWLKAQVPFVEFAEAVHTNPLGDSADTKIFIKP